MRTFLKFIFSYIYAWINFSFPFVGRRNSISFGGAYLRRSIIFVSGRKNKIFIGNGTKLINCKIHICGDNNNITIVGGHGSLIKDTEFWLENVGSNILIGASFWMEGGHLAATEGNSIKIGDNCLFSNDIEIRNGDSHSIFDLNTSTRINFGKDVVVGNHVWCGAHVRILKGGVIPNNSIVANSAIVTSAFLDENSIFGGVPAKILKTNISWSPER